MVALLFPAVRNALTGRDTAYVAWFGPIGIAGICYAALARGHLSMHHRRTLHE